MRTLIATYSSEEPLAQRAAAALHDAGLDGQYVLVLGRTASGHPAAWSGLEKTTTNDPPRSLHTIEGESLWSLLVQEYGSERAEEMLQTVRDGSDLVIAHTERYELDAVRAALDSAGPLEIVEQDLAYRQHVHPHPQPDTTETAPRTADFYTDDALDVRQHNYDEGLDYEARRSQFHVHYNQTYAARGWPFARLEAAYRFGLAMRAAAPSELSWTAAEPQLAARWQSDRVNEVPWEDVREAARYAWTIGSGQDDPRT